MLKSILIYMSSQPQLQKMATKMEVSRRVSRRFVAGEAVEQAVEAIRVLNQKRFLATMDYLGEMVTNREDTGKAVMEYLHALDLIHQNGINSNVSLKLTQFGLGIDEQFCMENVEQVVQRAMTYGNFVRIDMEGSPYTDSTLRIVFALHQKYQNVGTVIQSYLFRSEKDIADLLQQKIRIRLCKGAYKEPPEISFKKKSDTDANFVRLMKVLLKSGVYHGLATHDPAMVQAAREFAKNEKIGQDQFEFQMLFGIRRDLHEQLIHDGYNMRIYVPYGDQWYSYLMRRMAERPANLLFVLRSFFHG